MQCSVKYIENLSGHENVVNRGRVVIKWLGHWMQVPLYMWLNSLSMPQLRSLSIALKTMDRDLNHDSCLNPCLCHVWVENYAYQRKRLWRGDSNPWTGSLLTIYIIFNILHTINYIYLRSLSLQQHRFLSIDLNIMDRDVRHDSCLNRCLCHVWVENYAYWRKRLWRGDSKPWTGSLLTLYIMF